MCVSAFLVCALRVCFVYVLCIVFACFRCFFMNLLRVVMQLSCVIACVLGKVCLPFLFIFNVSS